MDGCIYEEIIDITRLNLAFYIIANKFLPIKDLIISFEIAINYLDINTKMDLRSKFISKLQSDCNKLKSQN